MIAKTMLKMAIRPNYMNTRAYRPQNPFAISTYLAKSHHVALIDDDDEFKNQLLILAKSVSIPVTIIPTRFFTLEQPEDFFDHFTVLLVDFDNENLNGLEIAEIINLRFRRIPTVLTSQFMKFEKKNGELPPYIDEFIPKSKSPLHILRHTLVTAIKYREKINPSYSYRNSA